MSYTVAELKLDALFLSNTVTGQYKPADVLRNLNHYYDEAVLEIWKADNSWKFDKGHDTLPTATTDLKEDQRDYQIPSTARKIEKVEILDKNDNWQTLTPIVPQDVQVSDDETGTPKYYFVKGRSVFIYPLSDEDRDQALRIHISRSVDLLTDDTDEPKIDREFQRYLSIGAALDWYFSKGNVSKSREMERKLEGMKQTIKQFYSTRNEDYKATFKPKRQSYL